MHLMCDIFVGYLLGILLDLNNSSPSSLQAAEQRSKDTSIHCRHVRSILYSVTR